jgi:hypothetical protein
VDESIVIITQMAGTMDQKMGGCSALDALRDITP